MRIHQRYGSVSALALLLTATSGCSDDETVVPPGDTEPPEVTVTYPSAVSGGTDASEIVVRGTASDPSGIEFITVNDVAVTTVDDFATWTVTVSLEEGENDLRIARLDNAGNGVTGSGELVVSRLGEIWHAPAAMSLTGDADNVLVADKTRAAIFAVAISSGSRRIISGPNLGAGPALIDVRSITYDGTRALVADAGLDALLAIDMTTGDRVVLSDLNKGAGPPIDVPEGIVYQASGNRVLVIDSLLDAVLSIDVGTGDRTLLSDGVTGTGAAFDSPLGLALDENNGRLLVTDVGAAPAVVGVDLLTGDRTVVSSGTVGGGAPMGIPPSIITDPSANVAYMFDVSSGSVVRLDLNSGSRGVVSSVDLGTGPMLTRGDGILFDAAIGQVLVVDSVLDAVVCVDLDLGDRKYVSRLLDAGSGPRLVSVTGMSPKFDASLIVDAANGSVSYLQHPSGDRDVRADDKIGSGPVLSGATDLQMNLDNHDMYVTDDKLQALVVVNWDSGDRTVVSDANTGSGTAFQQPVGLTLDMNNDRIFVADPLAGAVFSVTVSSGTRTVLTDAMSGTGPALATPIDVDYDFKLDRLLALDGSSSDLFAIDVSTGDRQIIASCLTTPKQLFVYETRAFVSSGSTVEVVDLATGTCSAVANDKLGSGPATLDIDGILYNPGRDSVFVNSPSLNAIVQIDVSTGDRMIVAK